MFVSRSLALPIITQAKEFANGFLQFHSGNHLREERLVQLFGGIVAGLFQLGLKRGDFDQAREITPWLDGNDDVRNVDVVLPQPEGPTSAVTRP